MATGAAGAAVVTGGGIARVGEVRAGGAAAEIATGFLSTARVPGGSGLPAGAPPCSGNTKDEA